MRNLEALRPRTPTLPPHTTAPFTGPDPHLASPPPPLTTADGGRIAPPPVAPRPPYPHQPPPPPYQPHHAVQKPLTRFS